jgi:hypothetical protein
METSGNISAGQEKNTVENTTNNNNKAGASSVPKTGDDSRDILWRDNEEYKIVKKLPRRFPTASSDIYVTNRTDFKAQYEKCKRLLSQANLGEEKSEIVLHAMGPAINRLENSFHAKNR